MIQEAIFIHSDPGHAKADRSQENEAKIRKNQRLKLNKKCGNLHFGYKLHSINRYGL
jgi:IS5 family transposase